METCSCGVSFEKKVYNQKYCSRSCQLKINLAKQNKIQSAKLASQKATINKSIPDLFIFPKSKVSKTKYFTLLEFLLITEVSMLKNAIRWKLKRQGIKLTYNGRKRVSYCLQDIEDLIQYYHQAYKESLNIELLRARDRYISIWKRINKELEKDL